MKGIEWNVTEVKGNELKGTEMKGSEWKYQR